MPKRDRLYRKVDGGTWYASYYTLVGRRRQVCLKTRDRRAAESKLREIERASALGTDRSAYDSAGSVTLLAAFETFVDEATESLSRASVSMYAQKARHLLRLLGGDTPIDALTRDVVLGYVKTRRREGAAGGTIYKETVALRRCLACAFDRGQFRADPRGLVPKIKNEYEPRRTFLSEEQFASLWDELPAHRRLWVAVACFVGLRRSEVERLDVAEHLDLARGWLRIPGRKTKRSARTVPIPPLLAELLAELAPADGPLVQPWPNVGRDLPAACRRAGVPRVTPNDLRRTFASWLVQQGESSSWSPSSWVTRARPWSSASTATSTTRPTAAPPIASRRQPSTWPPVANG